MGQKTNSIGMRLGNRLSWRSLWNVENNIFSETFLKDLETRHYLGIFLKNFGLNVNNTVIGSWQKTFFAFGRLVSILDFLSPKKRIFYLSKDTRKAQCLRLIESAGHISPRSDFMNFQFAGKKQSFFDFSKRDFLTNEFKTSFLKQIDTDNMESSKIVEISEATRFIIPVSSQAIADIVAYQISLSPKQKDAMFKFNLRKGVIWLVKFFFNQRMPFITGVKIICSGRWQKTRSGRKQRMVCSFGNIKKQTFSKHIDYGFSSVTTKYGVCGIKVWISYKIRQI